VSAQIAVVAIAAAVIGLLDATFVTTGIAGATGAFQFIPARIWVVAPAVWGFLGAAIGLVALPLMRRWGGVFVAAALATTFLAIRLRGHVALLLVLLAVGAALFIVARGWMQRWLARPRRAIAVCVVGSVIVSAILAAAPLRRQAPAAVREDAAGPNVVVIFLDTVRYDAVFDSGGRVRDRLPALARLRGESTSFTQAFSTTSWTLPSHLSAVTGLPAHQLGVGFDAQVYRRGDETLAERFHRRGYRTAAVISNSFVNAGTGFARGFDTFQHAQAALDLCRTSPGVMADHYWRWFAAAVCNWTASEVTRRALALMDDTAGPFFVTLNYMDAHDPYYVERACGAGEGYADALACLDRSLAPIVDWRSSRRPTVVAVVGDHGEQFGEHGLTRHGNSLYVQVLHVPLIVRSGQGREARTETAPISIAALPSLIDGGPRSEGPVLAVLHPQAATKLPSQYSALDGAWHLIVREDGAEALYYLASDPAEERDLAPTNPRDPAITRLRAAIEEMQREPKPDLQKFRSLGYIH
jgi:arylsulfatase A-like enzyme